jgi:hypothetical protein
MMKVTTVSAHIRLSRDVGSQWKTVELSAEATVDPNEDWALAQQGLYTMLTAQLRHLWSLNGHNGAESHVEATWDEIKAMPSPKDHWCPEHQTEFKRYEKDSRHWYSHSIPGGGWCKEQKTLTNS